MENPELYAITNDQPRKDAAYISEEFFDEISEISGRCLDIGSGPGDVTVDFILEKLNPNATIVCSDICEAMLKYGKEKYGKNDRISFVKLDIETPDLPRELIGQFDLVTSYYCLHWCQDMRQVFENIFKLLRPNGTALLLFLASHPVFDVYPALQAMPTYQPYLKDRSRYLSILRQCNRPRKTLKATLKDVGFDVRHCSRRVRTHSFSDLDVMREFFLAVNPFVAGMPSNLREVYEADLVRELMKELVISKNNFNGGDNGYSILSRYHIFVVHLKKPLCT